MFTEVRAGPSERHRRAPSVTLTFNMSTSASFMMGNELKSCRLRRRRRPHTGNEDATMFLCVFLWVDQQIDGWRFSGVFSWFPVEVLELVAEGSALL